MARAKVGTLRFGLHWAGVEPSRGTFDWSGPDSYVAGRPRTHIRLLPYLSGTPEWAARLDGRACAGDGCAAYAPEGRKALAAWSEFVDRGGRPLRARRRLLGREPRPSRESPVRAWQIWNEQNSPTFYEPRPNVNAFAKLLAVLACGDHRRRPGRRGHPRRHVREPARRPEAGLVGTGLPREALPQGRREGLRRGRAASVRDRRSSACSPRSSCCATRCARPATRSSELWITELGWASGGPPSPLNKGEKGQAAELERAFKFFAKRRKRLNIGNVDWYSWRDSSASAAALCEWCPESGLLEEDFTTKPSLDAFTTFTGGK